MSDIYEPYAIRYATRGNRYSSENFIVNAWTDGGSSAESPIDYYFWVIKNSSRVIIVDTGFTQAEATVRRQASGGVWDPQFFCEPVDAVRMLGVDPASVSDIVLTHLHFDHAGSLSAFPSARFHIQEREVAYATGPNMAHQFLNSAYSPDHIKEFIDLLYGGRVVFHDGDSTLVPGVSLHPLPGHTLGLQGVRVSTKRGQVLLASDSTHFYANFETSSPFPIVANVTAMMESFSRLSVLADSKDHIIPGHDPLVRKKYAPLSQKLGDVVFRLDESIDP
jgi:glyoxylase-like metal-dependent hydrolase (beta-lactamase superfamily II)